MCKIFKQKILNIFTKLLLFILFNTTLTLSIDFTNLNNIPLNTTKLLSIPTYDGSNQVVHPDIIIKDNKFILTITPYPYSKLTDENPSFYTSNDGIHFYTPEGANNPLVGEPHDGYNDDPDIIYDSTLHEYLLYYNETHFHKDTGIWYQQYLNLLRSPNGIDWSNEHVISFDLTGEDPFIVSPSLVKKNNIYNIFYVEIDKKNNHFCSVSDPHKHYIEHIKSSNPIDWNIENREKININLPKNFHPWHINISQNGIKYYMLINGYNNSFCEDHNLYMAMSYDLEKWYFVSNPLITASRTLYNSLIIYRSCIIHNNDNVYIYFSFKTRDGKWLLAIKHMDINSFDPHILEASLITTVYSLLL